MTANTQDLLCRYHYDPLDRLVGATPSGEAGIKRFYCGTRLATDIQNTLKYSIFEYGHYLLAQKNQMDIRIQTSLLATNQLRSVVHMVDVHSSQPIIYSPYGYRCPEYGVSSLLGFNGERRDKITGFYMLGNGYRAFNPILLRFNSPDSSSPFGPGGINSYVYCLGDPINRRDESGHSSLGISATLGFIEKKAHKIFSAGKRPSFTAPARNQGIVNTINGEPATIIKNKMPPSLIKQEFQEFIGKQNVSDSVLIMRINNSRDLKLLESDYSYKFVFTDQCQLIVGGRPGTPAGHIVSHSVLSHHAGNTNIISAGYIHKLHGRNFYKVDNYSGHYAPDFESLRYIATHIRGMGSRVKVEHWKKSTL